MILPSARPIRVVDPDSGDTIRRVEILTEEGKVAAAREPGTGEVRWTADLEPGRRYYLLRITLEDGDLAFSAPVWTGR